MQGCEMLKNSNGTGGNGEWTCMAIHKGYTSGPQGTVINHFGGNDLVITVCQYEAYSDRKHPPNFPQEGIAFPGFTSFLFCLICHSLFIHNLGDYPIPIQDSHNFTPIIHVSVKSPLHMPNRTRRKKPLKTKYP